MNWQGREDGIHAWWESLPEERYWLDVTIRDGREECLAAPRGRGARAASWIHRLITHVRGGDIVFHYDLYEEAIIACSVAFGRVVERPLRWPVLAGAAITVEELPSRAIGLRRATMLSPAVPLREIARVQWDLFDTLRALEDEVGDPLYYPFEMGDRDSTQPLAGYVFKLPAVLVHGLPELASAAVRAGGAPVAPRRSPQLLQAPRLHPA